MTLNLKCKDWWMDQSNLHQLALAIEAVEAPPLLSDFIEKPWKWEPEWNHFQQYGNLKEFEG